MITYMQFIDADISLNVAELNQDGVVYMSMNQVGQEFNEIGINLTETEMIRLRDWLTESIDGLKYVIKAEAP